MSNLLGYNRENAFQLDTSGYASIMCIVGLGAALYFNRIQEKSESKKMELNATFFAASFARSSNLSTTAMISNSGR